MRKHFSVTALTAAASQARVGPTQSRYGTEASTLITPTDFASNITAIPTFDWITFTGATNYLMRF